MENEKWGKAKIVKLTPAQARSNPYLSRRGDRYAVVLSHETTEHAVSLGYTYHAIKAARRVAEYVR